MKLDRVDDLDLRDPAVVEQRRQQQVAYEREMAEAAGKAEGLWAARMARLNEQDRARLASGQTYREEPISEAEQREYNRRLAEFDGLPLPGYGGPSLAYYEQGKEPEAEQEVER